MLVAHLRGDPREVAGVARTVVLADFLFTATAVVLQPLTGIWLAWAANYSLMQGWIALSILLYLVTGAFWLPVVWMQMRLTPRCRRRITGYSGGGTPSAFRLSLRYRHLLVDDCPAPYPLLGLETQFQGPIFLITDSLPLLSRRASS